MTTTETAAVEKPPAPDTLCRYGHRNPGGSRFCHTCGTPIRPPAGETAATASAADGPVTGEPAPTPTPAEETTAEAARPSRWWVWLLVVMLALAFCGVATFALFFPLYRESQNGPWAELVRQASVTVESALDAGAGVPTLAPTAAPDGPPGIVVTLPAADESGSDSAPPSAEASPVIALLPVATPAATAPPTAEPTPIIGIIIAPAQTETDPDANAGLLQNGDFSADWVDGWTREVSGLNGTQVVEVRGDDEGALLHMAKTGAGVVRLAQTVTLPGRATETSFRARVRQTGSVDGGLEGRSALALFYDTADGQPLGVSVWMDGAATETALWGKAPLPPLGPLLAPRFAEDDGWQTIEVDLRREFLDRLPGVNPDEVGRVTVMLLLTASDECSASGCAASLEVDDLALVATGASP